MYHFLQMHQCTIFFSLGCLPKALCKSLDRLLTLIKIYHRPEVAVRRCCTIICNILQYSQENTLKSDSNTWMFRNLSPNFNIIIPIFRVTTIHFYIFQIKIFFIFSSFTIFTFFTFFQMKIFILLLFFFSFNKNIFSTCLHWIIYSLIPFNSSRIYS